MAEEIPVHDDDTPDPDYFRPLKKTSRPAASPAQPAKPEGENSGIAPPQKTEHGTDERVHIMIPQNDPTCGPMIDDAPAPPAETGVAVKWEVFRRANLEYCLALEAGQTKEQAESAADWLNNRKRTEAQIAELKADNNRLNSMLRRTGYGQGQIDAHMDIEEENEKLLAKLATYKQQAEAWEAVRKHAITVSPISVEEGQYARIMFLNKAGLRESRYERWEELQPAVLALAAQLESQQPSDGKAPESQLKGGK